MVTSSSCDPAAAPTPSFFVVMPARNTASMIGNVLQGLSPEVWARIGRMVVLDNASTDETVVQVEKFLASHDDAASKVEIVVNDTDLGYGGSVQRGLRLALDSGCTHAIVIHSDDQCDWDRTIKRLTQLALASPGPDVVLACRFLAGSDIQSYSMARRLGNLFFKVYTHLVTGMRMADPGTAIMVIRADVLRAFPFEDLERKFLFHPQLNLLLFEDATVKKVETTLDWRDASDDNHFALFRYGISLLAMLTRYGWARRVRRVDPETALQALRRAV